MKKRTKQQISKDETSSVLLRIPTALLEQVDTLRADDFVTKNRTAWILEAVVEKFERDRKFREAK